jgi:stage IV sporulation protein B
MHGMRRLAALSFLFLFLITTYVIAAFWPVQQNFTVGEILNLEDSFPHFLRNHLSLHADIPDLPLSLSPEFSGQFQMSAPGRFRAQVVLNGVVPLRTVIVDVQPVLEVYPGGHAIGVLMHARGVIIVDHIDVTGEDGRIWSPAKQAGLSVGDVITVINGRPADNEQVVKKMVEQAGRERKTVTLEVRRNGKKLHFSVKPVFCRSARCYRIGLLIRDSTAGVGTLTFYDPKTRKYGALGHVVADAANPGPLELSEGRIIEAFIQGVRPGQRGKPGEKVGVFAQSSSLSGSIQINTSYGIFGKLESLPTHPLCPAPIPVALAHQVKQGNAVMLTVVDGKRLERFEIEITRVNALGRTGRRDVIIKVTDPRLLRATGGIIQGMSGSPIIQDGKLVAAVTHVYISNPERGYGIFAERMLRECGLLPVEKESKLSGLTGDISSKACCKIRKPLVKT